MGIANGNIKVQQMKKHFQQSLVPEEIEEDE
jgi:hypothetical protein